MQSVTFSPVPVIFSVLVTGLLNTIGGVGGVGGGGGANGAAAAAAAGQSGGKMKIIKRTYLGLET